VKRETFEKGTTWTDWLATLFSPSRLSRLSRAVILRESYYEEACRRSAVVNSG